MTVEALLEHLASDHLELDDFELRRSRAEEARSPDELRALLSDLPGRAPRQDSLPAPADPLRSPARPRRGLVHPWSGDAADGDVPPARLWVVGAFGGTRLDLRRSHFPAGRTEIVVVACLGSVHLLLPEELPVELRRVPSPGRASWEEGVPRASEPSAPATGPRVRIVVVAALGGVTVEGGRRGGGNG